jgi:hypothetical protein
MNTPRSSLEASRYGPGCARHKGDPHNLCQACWALEPDRVDELVKNGIRVGVEVDDDGRLVRFVR